MAVVRSSSMSMMRMSLLTKCLSVGLSSSRQIICQRGILKTHHRRLISTKQLNTAAAALENDQTTTVAAAESDINKLIKEMAGMLDIRVGLIVRAWKHPEADSLYVEEVDIGDKQQHIIIQNQELSANNSNNNDDNVDVESAPPTSTSTSFRLICSGLVNYMPLHLLQERWNNELELSKTEYWNNKKERREYYLHLEL